jgi:hypothetical protein
MEMSINEISGFGAGRLSGHHLRRFERKLTGTFLDYERLDLSPDGWHAWYLGDI